MGVFVQGSEASNIFWKAHLPEWAVFNIPA
jgi:hypothetical protein